MILEFELDDAAFGQAVTEKIVNETFGRKLFDGYSPMGAQVAETIRQEVRDIIRAREDEIVDRVVDTATDRIVGRLTAPRKEG